MDAKPSHTPGPCRIMDAYDAQFMNESPPRIETVWEVANAEAGETLAYATSGANARLIAAAPCLLAALKMAESMIHIPIRGAFKAYQQEKLDAIRAAIAKATTPST